MQFRKDDVAVLTTMSIYGDNAFYVGMLFIPGVFGIRYSLPKFLGSAETLSFLLAFDPGKRKKSMWEHAVL